MNDPCAAVNYSQKVICCWIIQGVATLFMNIELKNFIILEAHLQKF